LVLKTKKYCHFLKLVHDFSCKTMDPKDPGIFFYENLNLCTKWWFIVIIIQSCPHLRLITRFVTMVTRRVTHVEQELVTVPEHLSSPSIFSWVRAAHSLVFCIMMWRSLIVLLSFFFGGGGHCIVCPSSIYCFWTYPWSFVTQILRNG